MQAPEAEHKSNTRVHRARAATDERDGLLSTSANISRPLITSTPEPVGLSALNH